LGAGAGAGEGEDDDGVSNGPHCQKRKIEGGQVPGRAGTVELNSHLDETGPA